MAEAKGAGGSDAGGPDRDSYEWAAARNVELLRATLGRFTERRHGTSSRNVLVDNRDELRGDFTRAADSAGLGVVPTMLVAPVVPSRGMPSD